MKDRSNIIKEAIEYRDKLEKKVEELAQSVVRLQISLDFADNTIKKKDRENAKLKAENEKLKEENKTLEQFLSKEPLALQALQKGYASYKESTVVFYQMVETYKQTLQEIKAIAKLPSYHSKLIFNEFESRLYKIIDIINKAESEEE